MAVYNKAMRLPRDRDKLLLEGKDIQSALIYLDDELLSGVHDVDDVEGWAITIHRDDTQTPSVQVTRHTGSIRIEFPELESTAPDRGQRQHLVMVKVPKKNRA